jgi:predicted transcriptional regulator
MVRPRTNRKRTRLTVTLDADAYERLAQLAQEQDVSVAWVVRRAIGKLIAAGGVANDTAAPVKARKGGHQ